MCFLRASFSLCSILQWYPVESSSASYLLPQLIKTIKLALKSTKEERAILRARSAVQRFPVIEWRQKTEDFHKRSVTASRSIASANAWRPSDGDGVTVAAHADGWSPMPQELLLRSEWQHSSAWLQDSPTSPGSPGQWSKETGTPSGDQSLLPPRQLYGASQSSEEGNVRSTSSPDRPQVFNRFLERANRTITRDQRHASDPGLEYNLTRVFGSHSRALSVDSIASILDEKQYSPLNKAPTFVSSSISLALIEPCSSAPF
jgi:alpha-1,3-glucan synthase